jgi:hypothetical protein
LVAYSFRPRFARPIADGTKGGTIRADRKRHARPGEELQLYAGMRTRQCRLIRRARCLGVEPIALKLRGHPEIVLRGGVPILFRGASALDRFARFDGFRDFDEMAGFWDEDVFDGWHVRWLPWPWERMEGR